MDNFLVRDHLAKLNEDRINNLNIPITLLEIQLSLKSPNHKKARVKSFSWEFYKSFKEELIPILLKVIQAEKHKEHCPIYVITYIYLISKPHNVSTRKGNYWQLSFMNINEKILKEIQEQIKSPKHHY